MIDLKGANLRGADLSRAHLSDANLMGADLSRAAIKNTLLIIYGLAWDVFINIHTIQIGCETHKISEWSNFNDDKISKMNSEALSFWKENKEFILKLADNLKEK